MNLSTVIWCGGLA